MVQKYLWDQGQISWTCIGVLPSLCLCLHMGSPLLLCVECESAFVPVPKYWGLDLHVMWLVNLALISASVMSSAPPCLSSPAEKKILKQQITQTLSFLHHSWWQADGSRTWRACSPTLHIKQHLHFMSLNCFCCRPPHRLCDFVPVTVHPCSPEGAVIN